jgi:hypothetical protein
MYLILVKDNGSHTVVGIAQTSEEVKNAINTQNLQEKIDNGKAYLVEGNITLIRPETTPHLLDIKEVRKKKNSYY